MTTEITQAHWKLVMNGNPSYFSGDNLPVENVSWNQCQQFITQLNQMDPGKGYRLPTEAEWEYACRTGTSTRFFNGDGDLDLKKVGWFWGNSDSRTHPVGTKEPDVRGLYDMHGNVSEWCEDWFHDSYDGAPIDGSAWVSGYSTSRILRGGSWGDNADDCRSASRNRAGPDDSSSNIGFRLVYNP
jgi:formylglycine-generating enzyme required for sulfatase activity